MNKVSYQVLAYGVISAAGGIDGYISAGSNASLIAGLACGAALCAGAYGLYNDQQWGWWTSLVVSAALVLRFAPSFKSSGEVYPAGIMSAVGVWVVGALLVGFIQQVETD